mmetsp:Transcript_10478/g.31585  ORF Transcript_10478/g.31585 Transcript_10478/m.31585 type:complete len:1122 (-) Transcript_10478:553-3918(-)
MTPTATFEAHREVIILLVRVGDTPWSEFVKVRDSIVTWAKRTSWRRSMGALARLAPVEWRDWHAASGPGRGDSAFEHFSWRSSQRHLRFRFAHDGAESEQFTRELSTTQQRRGERTWRDPWVGYEPYRAIRGALGLKLKGPCTADDDVAAISAAIAAGAAATRCAARTYSLEDDSRERQGAKLVDVFDALLVEVCHALHAEARGSALERVGGPAIASTSLVTPLDVVSTPKKVGALTLLARRGSAFVATDEGVNEVAFTPCKLSDSDDLTEETYTRGLHASGTQHKGLIRTPSAAGLGFAKTSLLLSATMGGTVSSTAGKIQRGRRRKHLADLALLATCAEDALAHASEAYVELRADALHWQAGTLVTWCAAAVAVVVDGQGLSSVAATMPVPPASLWYEEDDGDRKVEDNGTADDRKVADDSRSYARRCVEAAATEAVLALEKVGAKGAPLLSELLFKLVKWRVSDAPPTTVAKALRHSLRTVEYACLGAVETARVALASAVICSRAGASRKAAVFAANAGQNCAELQNWAGAVLAWRLAEFCATEAWTMVRRTAHAQAVAAASRTGDTTEHIRGVARGLRDVSELSRSSRVSRNVLPRNGNFAPLASGHSETMNGVNALLADWFVNSLFDDNWECYIPPYLEMVVVQPPRRHGHVEVGNHLWNENFVLTDGGSSTVSKKSSTGQVASSGSNAHSAFFFDPFAKSRDRTDCDRSTSGWVVGERCLASVTLRNPLSVPIFVHEMRLATHGACCACHPTTSVTPVKDDEPLELDLEVTPLEPADELIIVGVVARIALTDLKPAKASRLIFLAFAPENVQRRIWPASRRHVPDQNPRSSVRKTVSTSLPVTVTVVPPQPRFDARLFQVAENAAAVTSILVLASRPGEKISLTLRLENLTRVMPTYFEVTARKAGTSRRQILFDASERNPDEEVGHRDRHFYEIFEPLDIASKEQLRASLANSVFAVDLVLASDLGASTLIGDVVVSYSAADCARRRLNLPFMFKPSPCIRLLSGHLRRPTCFLATDSTETSDGGQRCLVIGVANDANVPVFVRITSKSSWTLIPSKTSEAALFCESSADVGVAYVEWRMRGSHEGCFDGEGILSVNVDPAPDDTLGAMFSLHS